MSHSLLISIDEDTFEEGNMFDGSSVAGWKHINESDMILMLIHQLLLWIRSLMTTP